MVAGVWSWRQSPSGPIPIIAGRKLEQLEENLGCLEFAIDPAYQAWYVNLWHLVGGASMQVFEAVD